MDRDHAKSTRTRPPSAGKRHHERVHCLVTGATGYIGSRLVPRLLAEGHTVRCLTRSARKLRRMPWADQVEVAEADLTDPAGTATGMAGIEVGYYLVHSMGKRGFEAIDRTAATNFAAAARTAGLRRIIYLGGPQPRGAASPHLRSRAEVADVLLRSGVPTAVLRAAVIIGSGSASFEMLRQLTERLPIMVTPRWVRNRVQPIAIADVLYYLVACAALPPEVNRGFDIGGPQVLTYGDMMHRYAAITGLPRRLIVPVRPLTPRLSSYWVGLVTPVPAGIAKPLVASLVHEAVTREHDIAAYLPDPPGGLTGFSDAVRAALVVPPAAYAAVSSTGSDGRATAVPPSNPARSLPSDPPWAGATTYTDLRTRPVAAAPETLWRVITGIGRDRRWYAFPLAWAVRGRLDRLIGGPGSRPPTRAALRPGERLDAWVVEQVTPGKLLRLRAALRLPGRAWLELEALPIPGGGSRYLQRLRFRPRGLAGHAYWAAVRPLHGPIFGGLARKVAAAAERAESPGSDVSSYPPAPSRRAAGR